MNKYSISKRDVCLAIQADFKLIKLVNLNSASLDYNGSEELDENETENENVHEQDLDDDHAQSIFDDYDIDSISIISESLRSTNFSRKSNHQQHQISFNGGASSNEDGTSDSSTLCAESTSSEHLIQKYNLKVKEFLLEQNQHLTDLNILRRIFMYLFQKFSTAPNQAELIENIFGSINDVYECALKLTDSIDDSTSTSSCQQTHYQMVGQLFWDLCEGNEFDVYLKYALSVTNYELVVGSIKKLLNEPTITKRLEETSTGLTHISRYLLPKLLLSSLYHILYVYETIEYLMSISADEEDKLFLSESLSTLITIKYIIFIFY